MSSINGTSIIPPQVAPHSRYHYVPTQWIALLFVVLFGVSTLLHIGQTIRSRMWWLLPTICLAGVAEVAGWSGRLWSSYNVGARSPFLLQIITTIIAPTPLVAANFIILGRIIQSLGSSYSRIPPRWYTTIFCICDVIALVVQGTGGGLAASATTTTATATGGNVMLGGIVFQLVTITAYAGLAIEFYTRYFQKKPFPSRQDDSARAVVGPAPLTQKVKIMSVALIFSTLCLYIRAIYRTIELAYGWNGRVISTQVYFNVLDGGMVVLAIYTMNFVHPGVFLPSEDQSGSDESLDLKIQKPNFLC